MSRSALYQTILAIARTALPTPRAETARHNPPSLLLHKVEQIIDLGLSRPGQHIVGPGAEAGAAFNIRAGIIFMQQLHIAHAVAMYPYGNMTERISLGETGRGRLHRRLDLRTRSIQRARKN